MGPTARKAHIHDGDISDRLYRVALLAATLAFTAVLLIWSLTTPPFRGVHEHENFNAIIRLEYGGGWPGVEGARISQGVFTAMEEAGLYTQLPRSTADWSTLDFADVKPPAKYSVIDASNALEPADTFVADTAYVNPPLYFWIQSQAARAVGMEGSDWNTQLTFARFLNVLMAMWIPALIAASARHVATKKWAAATVAFLPLGIPELAHTVTAVAPDALLVTSALGFTAACTLVMHHGPSFRRTAAVGITLGFTALVSLFAIFLVPLVVAAFIFARPASKWLADVKHAAGALAIATVVGGIWWIAGQSFSHVVFHGERANTFLPPEHMGGSAAHDLSFFAYASHEVPASAVSFWGSFGYFEVSLNTTLAMLLTLAIFSGMVIGIVYAAKYRVDSIILVSFVGYLYVTFLALLYSRYSRGMNDFGFEGRFMYLSLGAAAAVLALGIVKMYAHGHVEDGFPTWLPLGSLGVGLFGLLTAFQGFYRPFDETLGDAFARWQLWTPGGWVVLGPAIVFLVLVVAVPIVVNRKILRPDNWEVPRVESLVRQR